MQNPWFFQSWRHNRTMTKLIPALRLSHPKYWIPMIFMVFPIFAFSYSASNLAIDTVPNLPSIKEDVIVCECRKGDSHSNEDALTHLLWLTKSRRTLRNVGKRVCFDYHNYPYLTIGMCL